MTSQIITCLAGTVLAASAALSGATGDGAAAPESPAMQSIDVQLLEDKIRGGWVGQMIGVSFGYPTEFGYLNRLVPREELPTWQPGMIREALVQDDLYVDITFAEVLDRSGLDAGSADFGAAFRDAEYPLWHANLAARRALRRGVPATLSGTPQFNAHANDIDFQIESDFIGLMSPGLPAASNDIALRVGRVMNHGDGIFGGMFVSAMYAAAFFESDPRKIVESGLAAIPADSSYAAVIRDVLEWSVDSTRDWQAVWQQLTDKWSRLEACPAGALQAFNIDAKINGGYIALGLLYGNGDFEKTMIITTRAGQDSDCNPASALGILGVILGFEGIPGKYTAGVAAIADEHFSFTSYSLNDIVASTLTRALLLIERSGGRVDGQSVHIATQKAVATRLPAWNDYGKAVEIIGLDDSRWLWSGDWRTETMKIWRFQRTSRVSDQRGAEARVSFSGSGVIVKGLYLPDGGTADIFLDGEHMQRIDVCSDEPDIKLDESVWHRFGLADTEHELRVEVRGEPFCGSEGGRIAIDSLIVFR